MAKDAHAGFLILSGKYGLLSSGDPIPYYDQLLIDDGVNELIDKVTPQLQKLSTSELTVYGKDKAINQSWRPYYAVLHGACKKLGIPYSEKIIVTPKIFALVGDFGSGKTSLRRNFSKYPYYFLGGDLFGYLDTDDFRKFSLAKAKPKVFRLNYYRDLLLESSEQELAIYDEDVAELLAYEFSRIARGESNIFDTLKNDLRLYRVKKPQLFPVGYIDLKCSLAVSEKRIHAREITERPTPGYFKNVRTKIAYRVFYNELFKHVPKDRVLQIDTGCLSPKTVFELTRRFFNKVLIEDYKFLNIFDYLDKLDLDEMKKRVAALYDKTK